MAAHDEAAGADDVHRRHHAAPRCCRRTRPPPSTQALEARGIPPASVAKMKPWMLSAMMALPACELARKAGGAPVLDVLSRRAGQGRRQGGHGLETAADQLSAMASLPMDFHIKGLVETLKLGDRMDDVIETMVVLYQRGDTGMFWPLFRNALPSSASDEVRLRRLRGGHGHDPQQDHGRARRSDPRRKAMPSWPSARCTCPAPTGWSSCSARPATPSHQPTAEAFLLPQTLNAQSIQDFPRFFSAVETEMPFAR